MKTTVSISYRKVYVKKEYCQEAVDSFNRVMGKSKFDGKFYKTEVATGKLSVNGETRTVYLVKTIIEEA